MNFYEMPPSVEERVVKRMGKPLLHGAVEARRSALVVIDMQNYFCAEGFPAEVPQARGIIPNINRLARAMRSAGGAVVWVQTTAAGAAQSWRNFETDMLTPHRRQERRAGLDEASRGYELFPTLEALPSDVRIKKIKYSAFIAGSSDLDAQLRSRGIDTVLIAGTLTNVCCESSARDAMMLDYKAVMITDGNATLTDVEHAAALNSFAMYFGDVMSTDQAIARLRPAASGGQAPGTKS
jgi:ureidoacrylate peracid hydrolase